MTAVEEPEAAPRSAAERAATRLRLWLVLSGMGAGELEGRGGLRRGFLARAVDGRRELGYEHLMALLATLRVDPGDFFAEVFPVRPMSSAAVVAGRRARDRTGETPPELDVVRLVTLGVGVVTELQERLGRCEEALAELRRGGLVAG